MCNGGDRVSLDGMATLGRVRGRGPRRSRGRDEVGTRSDEPSQTYPIASVRGLPLIEKRPTNTY